MINNPYNILLIEDNTLFRESLSRFINKSTQFECTNSYSSCETAIKYLQEEDPAPHIILLDIGLPGMSGIEGISYIKKITPSSKIVMLTIKDDDESIFKAICNGASGYLLKDSPSEKIIDSLKEVLNGGAPINSSIASRVLKMFKELIPVQVDSNLSQREKEILMLLAEGLNKKQIAEKLFLSYHTIDSHMRNIYLKLEVHSGSGAVAKAIKENLI